MNDLNVRRIEMCSRVVGFFNSNPVTFTKGSPAPQLVKRLADAVDNFNRLATTQTADNATARASSAIKSAARNDLVEAMQAISRCTQGMAPTMPGLDDRFKMSSTASDSQLLVRAKAFAGGAVTLQDAFLKFEMAPKFIEDLNAKIEAFEKAIGNRAVSKGAHVATSGMLESAMEIALGVLIQLDPIMENKLSGDPHELSRWKTARHLERAWVSRAAPVPTEPDVPKAA